MPKLARELSAIEVKRLSTPGLHFVGQVPGLALQVLPTGGRTWVLRSTVGARRRDMGLGGYPEISLADARLKARAAREQIRDGIDPIAQARAIRSALRAAASAALTFEQAASRYVTAHRPSWRNAKHAAQWEASLAQYVYPHIGQLNVADIGLPHILNVFEQAVPVDRRGKGSEVGKFWEVRTETATRLRGRIEAILDWAKGRGHRSGDNPAAWKGNLDAQLARPERIKAVVHHRAMPIDAIGAFVAELRQRDGMAARALEFAILTAARSGEVRGMRWNEVESTTWVIPATRMKARREHRVPLSKAAMRILAQLPRFEGEDTVFPAARGGSMSDMSLTAVMRRMGRDEVPHGFRSTFRDWAAERTHFPNEMAELALAHTISNAVEASYRRGDMFEKRRTMMEAWATFCARTGTADIDKVVRLHQTA